MSERHSNLKWCLYSFAKEADLEAKVEPATHDILNRGAYEYTPENVHYQFQKGSTKKHQAYSLELQESHAAILQMEPGKERTILGGSISHPQEAHRVLQQQQGQPPSRPGASKRLGG
jgi:hypothetical protein